MSDKTLDALYAKEGHAPQPAKKAKRFKVDFKALVTMGLGLAAPMVLGAMIRRGFARANPVNRITQKVAPFFEHNYSQHTRWLKGWPMIADGGFILTALVLTAGELASARSPREFKELAIQRNSIDLVFFFGVPFFMKLLSGSTTVAGALEKAQQKLKTLPKSAHAPVLQQAASKSAWTYVLSFLLGSLAVAGITIATNQMTRRGVKKAAEALDNHTSTKTTIVQPRQITDNMLPPVTQSLLSQFTA